MTSAQLLTAFHSACTWNAVSYGLYKLFFTILSVTLYKTVDAHQFALWANITSGIFLALLWLDMGFRKSIPHFMPHYEYAQETFTKIIIATQTALQIITLPIFLFFTNKLIIAFTAPYETITLISAGFLFIAEGSVATMRLIEHAQFKNKSFNTTESMTSLIEVALCLSAVALLPVKLLIITVITIRAFCKLLLLATIDYSFSPKKAPNHSIDIKPFIKHSGIMWGTTFVTSLSERNFLIPCITYMCGVNTANMFKVANDGALLLYRVIIKTIGTSDTSLLSHAEHKQLGTENMCEKLTTKIAALCFPLLGGVGFLMISMVNHSEHPGVFYLFTIMILGYIAETLFIAYERVIEVKRKYLFLCMSYIPHLFLFTLYPFITSDGLCALVATTHIVRLVSLSLCAWYARTYYAVVFPLRFVTRIALVSLTISLFAHICFPPMMYGSYVRIILTPLCSPKPSYGVAPERSEIR